MHERRIVETWIDREPNPVFDILVDLRRYGEWLPHSTVFRGTSSIAAGPIGPGTSYVETSIWGTRNGRIVELERPCRLSYRQPMTLRPDWLGVIDVRVEDTLANVRSGTLLKRTLHLGFKGPVGFFGGLVTRAFVAEIRRMHGRLKAHAERNVAR